VSLLLEPFELGFMRTALVAALCVSACCATVGVYVVLRRMAFIGDALAHTMLPGVVVAYLGGVSLLLGAALAGVGTALGIGWLSRRDALREDTAIGVVFTALFAVGVLFMSTVRSFRDLSSILFGNVLGVSESDLLAIGVVATMAMLFAIVFHKELELTSFDPNHARVIGLRPERVRYALLIVLSFTIVAGVQAVGVLLTSALLITPAAAASLLTDRLSRMMLLSVAIAGLSSLVGLYASYYAGVAPGAAIVVTCTCLFGCAWVLRWMRSTRVGRTSAFPSGR